MAADRGSWRWWGRGCCRRRWRPRWRTWCGAFCRAGGASGRAARGARTPTPSARWWPRGRRRARARWCSCRGPCPRGAEALDAFVGQGGRVVPGVGGGRVALLAALAAAGAGVGRRGGVPVGAVARVGVHGAGSDPGGEAGGGGARRRRGRPARVRRGPVGAVPARVGARRSGGHPEPREPVAARRGSRGSSRCRRASRRTPSSRTSPA